MEPYPMKWFRFYDEALNDPKVQRLPDASFKYWINLLCLANQGRPRGRIPKGDVAYALRMSEERSEKMVAFFKDKGLIEEEGDYLVPHGWDTRQFASDNVTDRVREHRRNVSRNVTKSLRETPPDTDTDTDTDTEADIPPLVPPSGGRAKALPDDWKIDESLLGWASDKGFSLEDVDQETEQFLNHFRATGKPMKNWGACWRNWMLRSRKYANPTRSEKPSTENNGAAPFDDDAMANWICVVQEALREGSGFDGDIPERVWDAVDSIGGFRNVKPEDGFQRRDFVSAYRAWKPRGEHHA